MTGPQPPAPLPLPTARRMNGDSRCTCISSLRYVFLITFVLIITTISLRLHRTGKENDRATTTSTTTTTNSWNDEPGLEMQMRLEPKVCFFICNFFVLIVTMIRLHGMRSNNGGAMTTTTSTITTTNCWDDERGLKMLESKVCFFL